MEKNIENNITDNKIYISGLESIEDCALHLGGQHLNWGFLVA